MIELMDFTKDDFELFKSWIKSEEELFQFAGPIFTYPVTDEQLIIYINRTDIKPLKVVLKETNETIGHCELNFENGNNRLSRILIGNKNLRGQKIGETIVRKMVKLLFENKEVNKVDLHVFDWNKAAVKCYENVGFKINPSNTDQMRVKDGFWTRLNMVLRREKITSIK